MLACAYAVGGEAEAEVAPWKSNEKNQSILVLFFFFF